MSPVPYPTTSDFTPFPVHTRSPDSPTPVVPGTVLERSGHRSVTPALPRRRYGRVDPHLSPYLGPFCRRVHQVEKTLLEDREPVETFLQEGDGGFPFPPVSSVPGYGSRWD